MAGEFDQQQNTSGTGESLIIQTDFVNPIKDKSKIEMGVRAAFNKANSTTAFYYFDPATGQPTLVPNSEIDY